VTLSAGSVVVNFPTPYSHEVPIRQKSLDWSLRFCSPWSLNLDTMVSNHRYRVAIGHEPRQKLSLLLDLRMWIELSLGYKTVSLFNIFNVVRLKPIVGLQEYSKKRFFKRSIGTSDQLFNFLNNVNLFQYFKPLSCNIWVLELLDYQLFPFLSTICNLQPTWDPNSLWILNCTKKFNLDTWTSFLFELPQAIFPSMLLLI